MQRLPRLAVVAELGRQPVEQFGMSRLRAIAAKVVGRVDDSTSKVVVPKTIGDRTPGEHVARAGEPIRQRSPAAPFVVGIRQREFGWKAGHTRERAGTDRLAGLLDVASPQYGDRSRCMRLNPVDSLRRRQGAKLPIELHRFRKARVALGANALDQPAIRSGPRRFCSDRSIW